MNKLRSHLIGFTLVVGLISTQSLFAETDNNSVLDGYEIFNHFCFLCHGKDGKGHGPLANKLPVSPANLANSDRVGRQTDRELFRTIQGTAPHGTVSATMPRWGLAIPESQIHSLVDYIRFLHNAKFPQIGDPRLGKLVYEDHCTVCHGDNGEGAGMLTYVIGMNPADHTDSERMESLPNEYLFRIIRDGSIDNSLMPGWKGILTPNEIENVIAYIRLLAY
ncbi:MAG: cytochrome c [Candidatus Polarisedimenticolaceae bacterium]|nr:cytochrome c [Candidatus Polarisedimenticolaceae bacterium]